MILVLLLFVHFISCHLDYCNSILYNVPKSKTDRLQTSESMCAYLDKIATYYPSFEGKKNWLKIQDIIIYI